MPKLKKAASRTAQRKRSKALARQAATEAEGPAAMPSAAGTGGDRRAEWEARQAAATGSWDAHAQVQLLNELSRVFDQMGGSADGLPNALAHMVDISPRDGLEGMLAAQMVSVHKVAMRFLAAGSRSRQPFVAANFYLNHAFRLMRLFPMQMEALNHHRGRAPSEQRVTVEHVHVHEGGQAVVGNVAVAPKLAPGGGGEAGAP